MNDYQIKLNMPAYYQKVLEYCNARLRGEDRQKIENYLTAAGYMGPTNDFCKELYERLLGNQELRALLDKLETVHQQCMEVRDDILAFPGFRFENCRTYFSAFCRFSCFRLLLLVFTLPDTLFYLMALSSFWGYYS